MNLLLHGIGADRSDDSPDRRSTTRSRPSPANYDMVLTNPPFGKKSASPIVNEEGEAERESADRSTATTSGRPRATSSSTSSSTSSRMLKQHGRAAVVVPDNVLFEGGAGETIRRELLKQCDVHTLLRLPTGIFYAQGVKANVLFFDRKPAQRRSRGPRSSGSTTCAPTSTSR